ncbi:DUF362 domain-containing protein [Candidatus Hydrogenedentota bacterium]
MKNRDEMSRRDFVRTLAVSGAGATACAVVGVGNLRPANAAAGPTLYAVRDIPVPAPNAKYHEGVDALLDLLGYNGRKFYKSTTESLVSGPSGMISSDDIVLVKVNAQWKYRGCTNSDVVKGIIQRVLEHPDGFTGEVVIFENGQGGGALDCTSTSTSSYPDGASHPNAENPYQHFSYLANTVFSGQPVTEYLLDSIRTAFIIDPGDHTTDAYRRSGNVSYPCFTTTDGNRVELQDGLWTGSAHADKLKLINIPVLKHHGGCGTTGALKHFYGILSMSDGGNASNRRHYGQIGNDCADMWCDVKTPVLTILDCIWVSPGSLSGYPESNTVRTNMLLSGFDPVALDYWASKYVLYPTQNDPDHDPDRAGGLRTFLQQALDRINGTYGVVDGMPATMSDTDITTLETSLGDSDGDGVSDIYEDTHGMNKNSTDSDGDTMPDGYEVRYELDPAENDRNDDLDGDTFSNYEEFLAGSPPNDPNWTPDTEFTTVPAVGTGGAVLIGASLLVGGLLATRKGKNRE